MILKEKLKWKFRALNPPDRRKHLKEFQNAEVPGTIQQELIKTGEIDEPFHSDNTSNTDWMYGLKWEYQAEVGKFKRENKATIVFNGLDTFCTVYLNGKKIGRCENMHRSYEFALNGLNKKKNILSVIFECPKKVSEKLNKKHKPEIWEGSCFGKPVMFYPHIRKAAYSGGWDWMGAVYPSIGIWRDAYLRTLRKTQTANDESSIISPAEFLIKDLNYKIKLSKDLKKAEIIPELEIESYSSGSLLAILKIDGHELIPSGRIELRKGLNTVSLKSVYIMKPLLWWPAGHGNQSTYQADLKLSYNGKNFFRSIRHIGIRRVRILERKDREGRNFTIEINGRKIFAKGANWIPCDAYLPRVSKKRIKKLVDEASKANFNMLRVWGGGIYEEDIFYEECTSKGIMVWQDFLFACSFYPEYKAFLNNVEAESEENIKRLRKHSSVCIFSGNNECHAAHYEWAGNAGGKKKFYGEKIYHKLLPDKIKKLCPDIPYTPGSPFDPDDKNNPNSSSAGDTHAWQTGFKLGHGFTYKDMADEKGRFISEFGYLGMSPYSSVREFMQTDCRKKRIDDPVFRSHENTIVHSSLLLNFASYLYPLPQNLKEYSYTSMLAQAEMLRFTIEHFRRRKFNCSGSLVWQFNDAWPGPSWSAVDYYLRRKAHFYYLKRAYKNVTISIWKSNKTGKIEVYGINDSSEEKLNLSISLYSKGDLEEVFSNEITLKGNSSANFAEFESDKFDFSSEFLFAELKRGNKTISRAMFFDKFPKDFRWPESKYCIKVSPCSQHDEFIIKISSETLLKDLYLNFDEIDSDALLEDNFIDLLPGEERKVKLKLSRRSTLLKVKKALEAMDTGSFVRNAYKLN